MNLDIYAIVLCILTRKAKEDVFSKFEHLNTINSSYEPSQVQLILTDW